MEHAVFLRVSIIYETEDKMLSAEKKIVLNMRLLNKPHSNHKICLEWRHKIIKGKLRKILCKAT